MFKNLGSKAEQSVPNDNELAEMFVPNCANAKAAEMKNTPARFREYSHLEKFPKHPTETRTVSHTLLQKQK